LFNKPDVNVVVYKWTDVNGDSIMNTGKIANGGELTIIGTALKQFTTSDSNFQAFSVPVLDSNGTNNALLEDNAWYWVAAQTPQNTYFVSVDRNLNYAARTIAAFRTSDPYREYYAPLYRGNLNDLQDIAYDTVLSVLPFVAGSTDLAPRPDTIGFLGGESTVPNISMHITAGTTGINSVYSKPAFEMSVYPNPASAMINAKLVMPKASKKVEVTIISAGGQTVYRGTKYNVLNDVISVPTSNMAPGTYFFMASNDEGRTMYRTFVVGK
jgi:hypothetical protein